MESYVSTESLSKRNALNSCLKSLQTMISDYTAKEQSQPWTQIEYYGDIKDIDNATFTYPRSLGYEVPIFGTVNNKMSIVGYTDGTKITSKSSITSNNRSIHILDKDEYKEISESAYKNGKDSLKTDTTQYNKEVVVVTTTKIRYTEDDGTYYRHTQTYRDISFNNCKCRIFMRF